MRDFAKEIYRCQECRAMVRSQFPVAPLAVPSSYAFLNQKSAIMFVGEGPGGLAPPIEGPAAETEATHSAQEVYLRKGAFGRDKFSKFIADTVSGVSGQFFSLPWERVSVSNALTFQKPGVMPALSVAEQDHLRQHLADQIEYSTPRILITIGGYARDVIAEISDRNPDLFKNTDIYPVVHPAATSWHSGFCLFDLLLRDIREKLLK
jgi:uracil-DNA glycosylase